MKSKDIPNPEKPVHQSDFWKNRKQYDKVQYGINYFFGPPIAKIIVPNEIVDGLNKTIDRKLDEQYETHGNRLVGQINHEPNLSLADLDESGAAHFFHSCASSFVNNTMMTRYGTNFEREHFTTVLYKSAWAVCQFQNEYNPVHYHTACNISSVMYLKIPKFDKRWKEDRHFKDNTVDGCIEFVNGVTDLMGMEMGTYRHRPKVGELFLFPSNLLHTVYPFKGDSERRSLAFNIAYQTRRKKDGQVVSGFGDPVGLAPEGMGAEMMPVGVAENLGFKK
tara:strand:+ start:121 stop:954 length:834 start_codon:yes stop_codon:yes gene_type:complete